MTQGPWKVDCEDNRILAQDARQTIICSFHGSLRNPEVMADARLIAAAPELLAALKGLVYADRDELNDTVSIVWHLASEAIRKAEGVS